MTGKKQPRPGAKASDGLRIEYLDLEKIRRFDRNPKKHDVGALVESIRRYGFRDAPIFDGTLGALVAGHGRLKALDELRKLGGDPPRGIRTDGRGAWLVPIQLGVDAASAAEAQAFLVDHNTLTVAGGDLGVDAMLRLYDQDGLGAMLKEMAEAGEMPVTLDGDDLDALLGTERPTLDAEPQIDRAAELQKKWGTARGQLWALGDHRLLCGDSSVESDVWRVIGGEKASIVFTDPPYGVAIGAKNRMLNEHDRASKKRRLESDIVDDALAPEELKARLLPAFRNLRTIAMSEDCTLFSAAPQGGGLGMMMMMMMHEAGLPVRHVLIWKKNSPVFSMGRLDYDYQHEPILLTWGKRHKRPMKGQHRTSVWEIDKPRSSESHPTMKPVELVVNALLNNSDRGDVSCDPYLGSGTTLIASEQTGRRCRAVEIEPGYVAVTLQRWADATGKTPELLEPAP